MATCDVFNCITLGSIVAIIWIGFVLTASIGMEVGFESLETLSASKSCDATIDFAVCNEVAVEYIACSTLFEIPDALMKNSETDILGK